MRLVFISDTHNKHKKLTIPECDILFHSGDWTGMGYKHEVEDFAKWLNKQEQCKNIVITPGNHEKTFEKCLHATENDPSSRTWITDKCPRAHLLIHEAVEVEGIKIFGSPWTPYFFNWAWNAGRTVKEANHVFKPFIGDLWKDIPLDTQILLTHGPAYGILDYAQDWNDKSKLISVGCVELLNKIKEMKDLKIHASGHLHLQGGKQEVHNGVLHINAAVCNEAYQPDNEVKVLDIWPELDWNYI